MCQTSALQRHPGISSLMLTLGSRQGIQYLGQVSWPDGLREENVDSGSISNLLGRVRAQSGHSDNHALIRDASNTLKGPDTTSCLIAIHHLQMRIEGISNVSSRSGKRRRPLQDWRQSRVMPEGLLSWSLTGILMSMKMTSGFATLGFVAAASYTCTASSPFVAVRRGCLFLSA